MSQSFPIDFDDAAIAHNVVMTLSMAPASWTDPRNGTAVAIRIRHDHTLKQRRTIAVLSALWRSATAALHGKPSFVEGMKVGTTGPRGCLWAGNPSDPDPLFKVTSVDDGVRIVPCRAGLDRFGVDEPTAKMWINAAIASTAEGRA